MSLLARPGLYGKASFKARPRGPPRVKALPVAPWAIRPAGQARPAKPVEPARPAKPVEPARPAKPVEHALPQLASYPPLHTVWLGQIYEACRTGSSVVV